MKEEINNPRRTFHTDIECVPEGYANGKATNTNLDKKTIINNASIAFGNLLTALGCDWKNDPNSSDTPMRVAKAYVKDLWKGRYNEMSDITSFPSDGYDGMVFQGGIPVKSFCSHHHLPFSGRAHVAYIPGEYGKIIGLSKLNRIVEFYSRRPQVQENLTMQIHKHIDEV